MTPERRKRNAWRDARIVDDITAGMTQDEVAAKWYLSQARISMIVRDQTGGKSMRELRGKPRLPSPDQTAAAYRAGYRVEDIRRDFQASYTAIYRRLDRAGTPRRGRGNHGRSS